MQPNQVILLIYLFKLQAVNCCSMARLAISPAWFPWTSVGRFERDGDTSSPPHSSKHTSTAALRTQRSTLTTRLPRLHVKPNQHGGGLKTHNSVRTLERFFAERQLHLWPLKRRSPRAKICFSLHTCTTPFDSLSKVDDRISLGVSSLAQVSCLLAFWLNRNKKNLCSTADGWLASPASRAKCAFIIKNNLWSSLAHSVSHIPTPVSDSITAVWQRWAPTPFSWNLAQQDWTVRLRHYPATPGKKPVPKFRNCQRNTKPSRASVKTHV